MTGPMKSPAMKISRDKREKKNSLFFPKKNLKYVSLTDQTIQWPTSQEHALQTSVLFWYLHTNSNKRAIQKRKTLTFPNSFAGRK